MRTLKVGEQYSIVEIMRGDENFYALLGPFFGSRLAAKELGTPIYDDDNRYWVVAVDANGKGIGCGSFEQLKSKSKAVMRSGWVLPEWRNNGIYDDLVQCRIALIRELGVKYIGCTITEDSKSTFARHGFREFDMRGKYHLMRKDLL